jgi:hypothetical protein
MGVVAYIDCNITETSRADSAPATPGAGAARRDPGGDLQRAIYTGWLHIKHEVVMGPDGMILFIWGPASARRNDLYALDKSGILAKWAAVMVPGHAHYVMYGDSIYPLRQHLRSRHGAAAGILKLEDQAMSSGRQSIENGFGLADSLFPVFSNPRRIKLMSGMPVRDIYF